ncbi:hypothetical protein IFM89_000173 [Coptis chinensis]|uniref:Uncharacterized protein n=1 Tax=Coptis chinensis TaxID=261450 RepID=A0A835I4G8_9MAGN|nr:hypothetical protein IFM89_000173 [Coptis chinensis]
MSTVEMEVFSNTQLVFMTILMLAGGEVFTSMFGLQFMKSKFRKFGTNKTEGTSVVHDYSWNPKNIELGLVPVTNLENEVSSPLENTDNSFMVSDTSLKYNSLRYLAYVVLAYLLLVLVGGSILVLVYLSLVSSAGNVLKAKGIKLSTFSVFTVVSTFANCGYVPTNENMIVFKNNPGLLLLLIPQILLGNTLYPSCLSAYGNVGFTTGYSCKRQINPDGHCKDTWYGFSGRWSNEGKLILILVMFFGRLKKFHMGGGKAWKLL